MFLSQSSSSDKYLIQVFSSGGFENGDVTSPAGDRATHERDVGASPQSRIYINVSNSHG